MDTSQCPICGSIGIPLGTDGTCCRHPQVFYDGYGNVIAYSTLIDGQIYYYNLIETKQR